MKHTRLFRSIAFLLALTLLPAPAHAVEQIYFTAVNITIMPLTADTMPVWIDGVLYVPYTVFDDHSNGAPQWMNLGAYGSYNTTKQTVSLYNRQGTMMFDLVEDTCYDLNSGRTYPSPAITRNKIPFVPVGQVCSFLGLTYSYLTVPQGILVRIKSSSNSLSDADLIDTGKDTLNNRLWEYNNQNSAVDLTASAAGKQLPGNHPSVFRRAVREGRLRRGAGQFLRRTERAGAVLLLPGAAGGPGRSGPPSAGYRTQCRAASERRHPGREPGTAGPWGGHFA